MLRQKLATKGYLAQEIKAVITFLLENNWLSDERFCESFIRSRIARRQGLTRIKYELSQKGICEEVSRQCFASCEIDWQALCDQAALAKVAPAKLDIKARQKLVRFLTYRGFSAGEVQRSIKKYYTGAISGEYDE